MHCWNELHSELGDIPFIAPELDDIFWSERYCVVTLGDSVLLFGGDDKINQLTPHGLRRVGTLPFQFFGDIGACVVARRKFFFLPGHEFTCQSRWKKLW